MSEIYVTATGFNKKTLAEIISELEIDFKEIFGDDIDVEADQPFGQLIGLLAKREADLWDGAEEIYNSRDPNKASGTSLDAVVAENAITRLEETATEVKDVLLNATNNTVIPAGKLARQQNTTIDYSLDNSVTVSKTTASKGVVSIETLTVSNTYTVTINATNYDYIAQIGDTKVDVLDEIKALIDAGSWTGTATVNSLNENMTLEDLSVVFSFDVGADMSIDQIWNQGDFTCTIKGANTLPANNLNIIQTPVTGWNGVNNPDAGITGRATETDDELRLRRERSIIKGNATDEAIAAALLNDVENVTNARVFSNRTDVTDGEGRPPHSFETVVQGGDDQEVADKIWETQPSGIQSFGNTTEIVTDSQGNPQTIKFSRPESVYIHVQVSRDLYDEESYPTNGDQLIKEAIVNWSLDISNIDVGKDVIRQRLSIPVYTVPGIEDIQILIDGTPNPGDTPTYAAQNITINDRELAQFSIDRIVVQDLP